MIIARSLGRTLDELGRTMTAEEFGLWKEAYREAPWAELRLESAPADAPPTDGAAAFAQLDAMGKL